MTSQGLARRIDHVSSFAKAAGYGVLFWCGLLS